MTAAAQQVLRDAMGLSPMERAELIDAFYAGELTDDSAEAMFARNDQT